MQTDSQNTDTPQAAGITVYKLVSVIGDELRSVAMGSCAATYRLGQVTLPPIPNSALFAFRTLEAAQQEFERLLELNGGRKDPAIRMEVWRALTTREVPGPKRLPSLGVWYVGLMRKCGYGAGFVDGYTYFWQNTAHCLRYFIKKGAGDEPSPSTIFCADLMILEQMPSSVLAREQPCLLA
jgi:hypothetical protein